MRKAVCTGHPEDSDREAGRHQSTAEDELLNAESIVTTTVCAHFDFYI